ncbi:MAG: CHAT domain-containing protein [Cyanobacteria bacterium P01_F01_bin.150]
MPLPNPLPSWSHALRFCLLAILSCLMAVSIAIAQGWAIVKAIDPPNIIEVKSDRPVLPLTIEEGLQAGIEQFQSEDYTRARDIWEAALSLPYSPSYRLTRALLLSNLSLAHQYLSQWDIAQNYITQSLEIFDQQEDIDRSSLEWDYYAKTLNTQGWLQWRQGQRQDALETWKQTTVAYETANNPSGIIGSRINQAQAMESLGLINQADIVLETVKADLSNPSVVLKTDPLLMITSFRHLGNALRRLGKLDESVEMLTHALELTELDDSLNANSRTIAKVRNNLRLDLGNTRRTQWDLAVTLEGEKLYFYEQEALAEYQEAIATAPLSTLQHLRAQTNLMGFYAALMQFQRSPKFSQRVADSTLLPIAAPELQSLWNQLIPEFQTLPASQSNLSVQLDAIDSVIVLNRLADTQKNNTDNKSGSAIDTSITVEWSTITTQLKQVLDQSRQLQDKRSESLALGYLGHVYEMVATEIERYTQTISVGTNSENMVLSPRWQDAAVLTEKAIALAETYQLPDILYRWEWQLGRIRKQQGNKEAAIDAYTLSAKTLETVRQDLLVRTADVQFSFRDDVEPVYRDLVDLLLEKDELLPSELDDAIGNIETLQLAELENFLDCDLSGTVDLSEAEIGSNAALIYAIIGDDHLDVVMKLEKDEKANKELDKENPDNSIVLHHRVTPEQDINATLDTLRDFLERDAFTKEAKEAGATLYQWMIQPYETELRQSGVETLVFVLDGELRNVPMAALRDQQGKYLVETYAIALTPRLQPESPQGFGAQNTNTLFLGLSEKSKALPQLPPLPAVEAEAQIFDNLSISSKRRLNEQFTEQGFQQDIQNAPFSILHFATHGEFSSNPDNTFLLAWDEKITSNQLRAFLQKQYPGNSIDLLVLSACKTAAGDNRATLGLAGIAFQAGAESTVASLWTINDGTTAVLMDNFYQSLIANGDRPASRAKALQTAQRQLINQRYPPYFWAPFVLVGNW